jgi:preprotein translocase subunit SecA
MAGRGTDILLGGNPEFLAQAELKKEGINLPFEDLKKEPLYQETLAKFNCQTEEEHKKVVALGGLHILGTERHESRRIDNQLRGRSGRQGDPGSSQFFSALEDDLIRQFGGDNIQGLMSRLGIEEDMPIEHGLITRSIETAQKRVENRNFELRKHILQYDDVMNQQRELIYRQRRQVLQEENLKDIVTQMIEEATGRLMDAYCPEGVHQEEWDLTGLLSQFEQLFITGRTFASKRDAFLAEMENTPRSGRQELKDKLRDYVLAKYAQREAELGSETLREIERVVLLRVVDEKWMEHLDAMDDLREGIGLRAYGQKDPLVEYKRESYEMFQQMIAAIQEEVVRFVFRVKVVQEPQARSQQLVENRYAEEEAQRPTHRESKVGRNALCPCGSGKKYKKCCGRAAS